MPSFSNLDQASGLTEFNKYLETRSYIDGYKPSAADSSLLTSIHAAVDASKYPHVARWLSHITSFSPAQRALWGGVAVAASSASAKPPAAAPAKKAAAADSDDDFGMSSDDDDEAEAIIARKAAEHAAKKAATGKAKPVAKSSVILFVKPEDAETDMNELAAKIKSEVVMDSLQWGDYELIPIAYGIKKLRIICVIEDDKIQLDDLTEAIEEFEEVQSVDIDAFNKL